MARYIRGDISSEMTDEQYADLANSVWMLLRNTPYGFHVGHDGKTPVAVLNDAWAQYGDDAAWE